MFTVVRITVKAMAAGIKSIVTCTYVWAARSGTTLVDSTRVRIGQRVHDLPQEELPVIFWLIHL